MSESTDLCDAEIKDFYVRQARGIAVIDRLSVIIGAPEKSAFRHRDEVLSKVMAREWFPVSVETLEKLADEIDRLRAEVKRLQECEDLRAGAICDR